MGSREAGTGTSNQSGSPSPSGCCGKGDTEAEAEMERRRLARTGMTRVRGVKRLLALPRAAKIRRMKFTSLAN